MRIDSHVHLWRFEADDYPWISAEMQSLKQDRLASDLRPLMLEQGIDACIAVQAREKEEETDSLLDLANDSPWIAAVIGWVDLTRDDISPRLEHWADVDRLRGFRYVLQNNPETPALVSSAAFLSGVRLLQNRSLVYEILISADQLKVMHPFCRALDDHWLVLDHLGKPDIRGRLLENWRRDVEPLARMPHVVCKLSGLVTEAADATGKFDESHLHEYLDAALELFGPDRILFGTDWPVCTLVSSYAETTRIIERWSSRLSPAEQASLWGNTAARVYGLKEGC
ncbi:MAG: amidohydrolase family protein [Povalibacter sp.]